MRLSALIATACLAQATWLAGEARGDAGRSFEPVAAILEGHCLRCHQGRAAKGDLDLTTPAGLGEDVVVPGKPGESRLFEVISGAEPTMPKAGDRLDPVQVEAVRAWIADGAPWPGGRTLRIDPRDWWSLRPLARPPVPEAGGIEARSPIDAFILQGLRARGIAPSPEADRATLIRRVTFDLIGLPPTPEEVEAFRIDPAPGAYERVVDRLLVSPHFGERWGRHWLDVARYGDTHGYDKDQPRPNAWPYRDYVIRAFNEDKPYGRFVLEQVAGDVLFPGTVDGVEATGFLAAGPWDFIGHAEVPETKLDGQVARLLDRDDMVSNTLNAFASLTVQCARCHDHKFDPVSQADYYGLQAVFAALDRADRDYDADPAMAARRSGLTANRSACLADSARLGNLAGALGEADRAALAEATRRLAEVDRDLAALPARRRVYAGTIHHGTGAFRGTGPDGGKPRVIRVLRRGEVRDPLQVAEPGAVALIPGVPARFDLPPDAPEGLRRAALARWLVDPRNPLTWRSIVNRVWHYHFGRGLVDSPSDFGRMGRTPSHPDLLDWLAADFRDGGQSLKRLHRQIVTSATYRQASASDEARSALDGENVGLWRMNRRRLEAEAIRDAVLMVAGQLDRTPGGPGFRDFAVEHPEHSPHYEYGPFDPEDPKAHRRSVYRFIVRSQPQPFLAALDCADPSMSVDRRDESTTALQALALRNDRLMVAMAGDLAARLRREAADLPSQIDRAYLLALGRPAKLAEREALAEHAARFGLANACRVIFNLNEFVFVD